MTETREQDEKTTESTDILDQASGALTEYIEYRNYAATLSREVSEKERERTALRHKIAKEIMANDKLSKTAAMDQSRQTDDYLAASSGIDAHLEKWEKTFAGAEFFRMKFQLLTLRAKRDYETKNAAAELERMQGILVGRVRELRDGGEL